MVSLATSKIITYTIDKLCLAFASTSKMSVVQESVHMHTDLHKYIHLFYCICTEGTLLVTVL